ncbi:glycoside hydrolase family 13 protein [Nibrella saemangeumensis]|uniref:Glycoside hydrolase family 13 protein n=1 Tax=Nibrella saemangeumensis TaxID=1084526 RepID=A0ABP8MR76_9BACT
MKKHLFPPFIFLAVFLPQLVFAQAPAIQRVEPTNWWVGMKNPNLQLLVYGKNIGSSTVSLTYPGVRLKKVNKVENPNYLFVDLDITPAAKPGTMVLTFANGNNRTPYRYELRRKSHQPLGVTPADLIYLIMPDRFANGSEANDKFADMLDPNADANNPYLRHGGDIQGIINHLDYLQDLGVTALWMTPVIQNDELLKKEGPDRMQAGYHGYHFTDHYKIDRRFGGNEAYSQLSKALHQRGMKLVQDAVYNHVSDDHWFYKDQPTKDWFNTWSSYTNTSHKEQSLYDPHAAPADLKVMLDGWFTPFLPDLNQRNPYLANYLIQHAIWSTELFNLDAWRIDTYKYNDMAFMNRCNQTLLTEYPKLLLFGESLVSTPAGLSYFVKNNLNYPFKSNLPSTLDFPLFNAINGGLQQNFGWDTGVSRVHQTLAQDAVYADPMKLVTYLDNHDENRYLSVIGDDLDKYKMGVTWLLTTRGIPSLYYGTEILMKNFKDPTDAEVRRNFPGGFPGDRENKFTAAGRSRRENEAFDFVRKLANYRRATPALHSGKLMQYIPQDGLYTYFRYDNNKTVMVATNTTDKEIGLDTGRFTDSMKGFTKGRNVLTDETVSDLKLIKLPAKTAVVLELMK